MRLKALFTPGHTPEHMAYLLLPDPKHFKGARPVVIALHGTGGNKDHEGRPVELSH